MLSGVFRRRFGRTVMASTADPGPEVSPDKPVVATPSAGSAAEPERKAIILAVRCGVGELAANEARRVELGAQCQSTLSLIHI